MTPNTDTQTNRKKWYRRPGCLIPFLIALLPILFVGYGFLEVWIEKNRPTYYEQGSDFSLDDLPASARDVRFSPHLPFSPSGRKYEFKCTEGDYREWVKKTKVKHPELSDIRLGDPYMDGSLPTVSREGTVDEVEIEEFLISSWRYTDQGFYLAYDIKGGRAIRWSHSR